MSASLELEGRRNLQFVATGYELVDGLVRPAVGAGHYYPPLAEPLLLYEFECLEATDDVLAFATRRGLPGVYLRGADVAYVRSFDPSDLDEDGNPVSALTTFASLSAAPGTDVQWILEHAATVRFAMAIVKAMPSAKELAEVLTPWLAPRSDNLVCTFPAIVGSERLTEIALVGHPDLHHVARSLVSHIVSGNLGNAPLMLAWAKDYDAWQLGPDMDLLGSVYWHLAQWVVRGPAVNRCEECGKLFEPNRKGQRYCPPEAGKAESLCAQRVRQRRFQARQPGEVGQ